MFELYKIELHKIFRKPRTYISFIAIFLVVGLIQLAFKSDGDTLSELLFSGLKGMFQFDGGNLLNGYFVCYMILNTLLIQVPLLVALVTGDLISGEANMGTLRLLLTKPISRQQIVLAKFAAGLTYTFLLLVWMALISLFLSVFIFGRDDLIIGKSFGVVQLVVDNSGDDIFWRYLCAFALAFLALSTVAALSFMLSVFAENSIGPIVSTMSIIIVFTIISTMDMPLFQKINPFLFTSYMTAWKGFFNMASNDEGGIRGSIYSLPAIIKAAGILVGHIVVFVGVGMYSFTRKDILS
ncbi:MAG: ABC transporter permease subunit [Chitinophagaceae bacterium]